MRRLREDPTTVGGRLSGKLHGLRSTRLIGNYRLLFQVDTTVKTVYLVTIDHRGRVY